MAPNEFGFLLSRSSSSLFSISVLNCGMPHVVSWLCTAERQPKWAELVFSQAGKGIKFTLQEHSDCKAILWMGALFFFNNWCSCRKEEWTPFKAKPKVHFEKYKGYFYWKYGLVLDEEIMTRIICMRTYVFSLNPVKCIDWPGKYI